MDTITLQRAGRLPLAFVGTLLAEEEGQMTNGRENARYHTLTVYRTASGKYVAYVTYDSNYQGEEGRADAEVCEDPAAVEAWFRAYDPTAWVVGFPPGDAYAAKQARLLADVRSRYENQVGRLLDACQFSEEVP